MNLEEHGLALLVGARIVGEAAVNQREEEIRRAAAAEALREAADEWPDQGIVSLWLRKRADIIEESGSVRCG